MSEKPVSDASSFEATIEKRKADIDGQIEEFLTEAELQRDNLLALITKQATAWCLEDELLARGCIAFVFGLVERRKVQRLLDTHQKENPAHEGKNSR